MREVCCEQALFHDANNFFMHFGDGVGCVHRDHALRGALGNGHVCRQHAVIERAAFFLKAVLVVRHRFGLFYVSAAGAGDCPRYVRDHQDRQVRLKIATQNFMQLQHDLTAKFAAAALVSFTGVGKAVAQAPIGRVRGRAESARQYAVRGRKTSGQVPPAATSLQCAS